MLIEAEKYICSLKKLWSDVFGDSDEYISLIFDKGYTPAEIFGEICDGEIVSALYLLKCRIESGSRTFYGRYLYAAATDAKYRKQGVMARLIDEAKAYITENNIDFIALLPADEGLYGYYSKFGFEPLMHKYVSVVNGSSTVSVDDASVCVADSVLEMRSYYEGNKLTFEAEEMKYALSCLCFTGYKIYKNSADSYYISNEKRTEIIEYISSDKNFSENTQLLFSKLNSGAEISSPYDLSGHCESKKQTFGMIFTENNYLRICAEKGIYMNIALD